jgi:hypothetical protein
MSVRAAERWPVTPAPGRYLCLSVDVQGYSSHDDFRQSTIQDDLIAVLERAAGRAGLDRGRWIRQAKGDEELALIPAGDRPDRVVGEFCLELDAALRRHNSARTGGPRLRLRLAMDEGMVSQARNGFAGRTVVAVSRLVSSAVSREALRRHPEADLVIVLSDRVYADWVCSGRSTVRADLFRQVVVTEKEYTAVAWLWLPAAGRPSTAAPEAATGPAPAPSRYPRRARLAPAVLATLPACVLGLFCLPAAGLSSGAVAILAGVGTLPLLAAQIARDHGRRIQAGLFRQWGGRPTELMLRWHGAGSPHVVARRHQLIAQHLGFALPDEKEELDDPERAEEQYAAAVAALRERTRDTSRFPLVMAENITYGFWRNMYASRVAAVVICGLCGVATVLLGRFTPAVLTGPQIAGLLILDVSAVIGWLVFCRPATVRRAAEAYGNQLFASLETLRS